MDGWMDGWIDGWMDISIGFNKQLSGINDNDIDIVAVLDKVILR